MSTPALAHFALLTHAEQVAAVRRLAAQGWSDHEIARNCGLHIDEVRRCLVSDFAPSTNEGTP